MSNRNRYKVSQYGSNSGFITSKTYRSKIVAKFVAYMFSGTSSSLFSLFDQKLSTTFEELPPTYRGSK